MLWTPSAPVDLQPEQIALWADKLERESGVTLGQLQASRLSSQIGLRMRSLGLDDADRYFAHVCQHPPEWQTLLAQLLVQETHFFRNRDALDGIQRFVRQRGRAGLLDTSVDACSLGCASGEEAYSLAATLYRGLQHSNQQHYYSVTGVDICQRALSRARSAVYGKTQLAQISTDELHQFFSPMANDQFRVQDHLRDRVTFVRGNLCDDNGLAKIPMDVIVCLNVLIYFRRWRRKALLDRLVPWLKPGGLLVVGSGELPGWSHPQLTSVAIGGVQAYQKISAARIKEHLGNG